MESKDFMIENGVLTEYKGSGGDVTIPESVTKICESAFDNCTSLQSVTFMASVTEMWDIFMNCENLTIHVPSGSDAERYAKENGIPFEVL